MSQMHYADPEIVEDIFYGIMQPLCVDVLNRNGLNIEKLAGSAGLQRHQVEKSLGASRNKNVDPALLPIIKIAYCLGYRLTLVPFKEHNDE